MPSAPKWLFDTVGSLLPNIPSVEVTETTLLSASVRKIGLKGDFKELSFHPGSYIDFRVSDTQVRRYTVSYVNTENSVLEFIVHLHGEGCGSSFMNGLTVSDTMNIYKPRSERRYYDKSAERVVIFGDETSLGLARSFLPVLNKNNHTFQFIFELDSENNNVPELLGLTNCLVFPKKGLFTNEKWISELPVIQIADWQQARFVLTGNVKSAQTFKKVIKNKTNGKVFLHGYWLEGRKGL